MSDALALLAHRCSRPRSGSARPMPTPRSSAPRTPITATTRRRSRCASRSRCAARRARSPRSSPRPRARARGWRAPTSPGPASSTCGSRRAWYAEAVRGRAEPGFGGGTAAAPLRVNVEYVSANPTGPLPVSAGRNAAYGDSLARLFAFAGHDVTREYYFNDAGAQIERFGLSLRARARGEPVPEDGYKGDWMIELATGPGSRRTPGRGVRRRGRRADVRGDPRDARALPGADGRLHERGRPAPLGRRRARARARPCGRPRVRADGATWLRDERVRRRQGSRPAQGRRLDHVFRGRSRLPGRQARARLRPRGLRARRRHHGYAARLARQRRRSATTRRASRSRSTRWCI